MTGKFRFLYLFVAIVFCVSIVFMFSGKVKAADEDVSVESTTSPESGDPGIGHDIGKGEGHDKGDDRPPGWDNDKGKKEGWDGDVPPGHKKPSPSE